MGFELRIGLRLHTEAGELSPRAEGEQDRPWRENASPEQRSCHISSSRGYWQTGRKTQFPGSLFTKLASLSSRR
jgi:hypothetical protein